MPIHDSSILHRDGADVVIFASLIYHTTVRNKLSPRRTCTLKSDCVRSTRGTGAVSSLSPLTLVVCSSFIQHIRGYHAGPRLDRRIRGYISCVRVGLSGGVHTTSVTTLINCARCCLARGFGRRANLDIASCVGFTGVRHTGILLGDASRAIRSVTATLSFDAHGCFDQVFRRIANRAPVRCHRGWVLVRGASIERASDLTRIFIFCSYIDTHTVLAAQRTLVFAYSDIATPLSVPYDELSWSPLLPNVGESPPTTTACYTYRSQ